MQKHIPVLLQEAITSLALKPGATFLDGTLGGGGHSAEAVHRFGRKIHIIGLDRDRRAAQISSERLRTLGANIHTYVESFRNLDDVLWKLGIKCVDAILFDLGISSDQLETSGRGFTFQKDEPLLMTMSEKRELGELTARDILNAFDEDAIELILRGFGEEKYSRRIAREIVRRREVKHFETTFDLLEAIRAATPASPGYSKINPATRTFQALRIAVNEELTALEEGLEKGFKALGLGGRLAVISFHSLEDRVVKNYFKDLEKKGLARNIYKKPVSPSEMEIAGNPRSRSAKLRVIEKKHD
jgi:16S rRNA (cytosine1402-N4)-methyltransferase